MNVFVVVGSGAVVDAAGVVGHIASIMVKIVKANTTNKIFEHIILNLNFIDFKNLNKKI